MPAGVVRGAHDRGQRQRSAHYLGLGSELPALLALMSRGAAIAPGLTPDLPQLFSHLHAHLPRLRSKKKGKALADSALSRAVAVLRLPCVHQNQSTKSILAQTMEIICKRQRENLDRRRRPARCGWYHLSMNFPRLSR